MSYKRMTEDFKLDATYGFQTYPIVVLPDDFKNQTDLSVAGSCRSECGLQEWCTLHTPFICEKKISFEKITSFFPTELSVPKVFWGHTGQCDIEEMFAVWYVDENTKVYAQCQRAGLRVRNKDGIAEFLSFEFMNFNISDVDFIMYLADGLQGCTETRLFICTKGGYKKNAQLIPLQSESFRKWLIDNARVE